MNKEAFYDFLDNLGEALLYAVLLIIGAGSLFLLSVGLFGH